jgi:hypothetical protein
MGFQWAVRVGHRLQSRFGQSGAVRKLNLVQIVVEVSAIRGGLPSTCACEPVLAVVVAAFRGTIGMDCSSERRAINYIFLR